MERNARKFQPKISGDPGAKSEPLLEGSDRVCTSKERLFKQYQCDQVPQEPDFTTYEVKKAAWVAANPDATHSEYEAAMYVNALECGV